jgi:predicted phosphodiesterase
MNRLMNLLAPVSRENTLKRLDEVYAKGAVVPFDDDSRIVIMSDSHRGDNSWTDDFAQNEMIMLHALRHYYDSGYTYIEAGDGDELWENDSFEQIRDQHSRIFDMLVKFWEDDRFYLMWGNHDIERQDRSVLKRQLVKYYDPLKRKEVVLFGENIEAHEGIVLQHRVTGQRFFVVHGHQGGGVNDERWQIGRFAVKHFWRHLQFLGLNDPTRPSTNIKEAHEVEDSISDWICQNSQAVICGHTHRSAFPLEGGLPYFNTGSAVFPRQITGIEIVRGTIALVGWLAMPDANGVVRYCRLGGFDTADPAQCQVARTFSEGGERAPIGAFRPEPIGDYAPEKRPTWTDCPAGVGQPRTVRSRGL